MILNAMRRTGPAAGRVRRQNPRVCEAVEQLRKTSNEVEAFINVLDEGRTGPPQVRTVAHSSG